MDRPHGIRIHFTLIIDSTAECIKKTAGVLLTDRNHYRHTGRDNLHAAGKAFRCFKRNTAGNTLASLLHDLGRDFPVSCLYADFRLNERELMFIKNTIDNRSDDLYDFSFCHVLYLYST